MNKFASNYIDDILIYSKTYNEHIDHIQLTLAAIEKAGFKLNRKKCKFAQKKITYLGHEIGYNYVKPLNDNIIAIKEFPTPTSRTKIRQFLGKINFYLQYIPNAAILLEPLHKLLRKNIQFDWSEQCQQTFTKIKNYLCTEPILAIFNPDNQVYIYTDAYETGVGAVLKQYQKDKSIKPVFYFSRKLTDNQKRKKAIYLESLAIKEAIQYWQYYLMDKKFIIYTDHKPLEHFNIKNCQDPELREILNYISQYNLEIIYNPGKNNLEADWLSRNPVLKENTNTEELPAIKTVNYVTTAEIKQNRKLLTLDDTRDLENDIIYKKLNNIRKIWVTEQFGTELINRAHEKYGHIGIKQLTLTIARKFYFKNMHKHIKLTCRSCETCVKNKSRTPNCKAPLS